MYSSSSNYLRKTSSFSSNLYKMLKKKLKLGETNTQTQNHSNSTTNPTAAITPATTINGDASDDDDITSKHFETPFWKQFYDIECSLNDELRDRKFASKITHVYNPIEYTKNLHCEYLKKYLTGPKKLVFVGMNPGPNGMIQTGVPFGNITTVRNWMNINGEVDKPNKEHPKRLVKGLSCTIEEPSGVKLWGLLREISTDLQIFSQQCYVHNFCPLAFFDLSGANITPSELKGDDKKFIRETCLKYLEKKLELISPQVVVAIGSYVDESLKILQKRDNFKYSNIQFLKLAHPSSRSLNNANWPEKARKFLEENDLLKFLKNERTNM